MSAPEIRKKILEKLGSVEDEQVLKEIYEILEAQTSLQSVYTLTAEEKNAVEEGLEDLRLGKTLTAKEANAVIQEWLKK